jgi:hypothetical protein
MNHNFLDETSIVGMAGEIGQMQERLPACGESFRARGFVSNR